MTRAAFLQTMMWTYTVMFAASTIACAINDSWASGLALILWAIAWFCQIVLCAKSIQADE